MPKLFMLATFLAILAVLPPTSSSAESGLGLMHATDGRSAQEQSDLRIPIAALAMPGRRTSGFLTMPEVSASLWGDPVADSLWGEDFLTKSLLETNLSGNKSSRLMPYAGGWAAPPTWQDDALGLAPGDQTGTRYVWNVGGGLIWFFRDVLGVDLGLRYTEGKVKLSRAGLRIGDVKAHGKFNLPRQEVHIQLHVPLY